MRTLVTTLLLTLSLAPAAFAQAEPEEPEPIADFWSAEEEAGAPGPQSQSEPPPEGSQEAAPAPAGSAPGQAAPPPGATATTCDPAAFVREVMDAVHADLRRRPVRLERGETRTFRARPCIAGTLEIRLLHAPTRVVVARGRAALRPDATGAVRVTRTAAGARLRRRVGRAGGGKVRLRLRVTFARAPQPAR